MAHSQSPSSADAAFERAQRQCTQKTVPSLPVEWRILPDRFTTQSVPLSRLQHCGRCSFGVPMDDMSTGTHTYHRKITSDMDACESADAKCPLHEW